MKIKQSALSRLGMACTIGDLLFMFCLYAMVSIKDFPAPIRLFFERHDCVLPTLFFLSQIGFMSALFSLLLTEATGRSLVGKALLLIPFSGQLCYASTALLPAQTAMTLLPIPLPQLGAILNATGMVLVGIAVLRTGTWRGWLRWLPLLTGLYPFVVMFPVLMITGHPPRLLIGIWDLVWSALGYVIHSAAGVRQQTGKQNKVLY